MYVIAAIFIALLLIGCVDPADFENENSYTPANYTDTVEYNALPTVTTKTVSSDGLVIEISKEIPIPPVHLALGWKDHGEELVQQRVDLQFVNQNSYSALIVTHHIWDYSVSAEFPVIGGWVESLELDGNVYTNKVRWTDGSSKTIAIKYKNDEINTISIGQRVFYLRNLPTSRHKGDLDIILPSEIYFEGNRGEHIVQKGESANRIAKKYKLSLEQLKALNPEIKDLSLIQPGDGIKIEY